MHAKTFYILIGLTVSFVILVPEITGAVEYKLKGRVIHQDLNCEGKKVSGISGVSVVSSCETGGPSAETGSKGYYELKYECGTCINMLIYYTKKGFMPEKRRIRSDMTNGSLGDITMREIKKHSDYRYDDIMTLLLSINEVKAWLIWRPSPMLNNVLSIWRHDLSLIEKDAGPAFWKARERFPILFQ